MSDRRLTALQERADQSGDAMLQWAADEIRQLREDRERLDYAENKGLGGRALIDAIKALENDEKGDR